MILLGVSVVSALLDFRLLSNRVSLSERIYILTKLKYISSLFVSYNRRGCYVNQMVCDSLREYDRLYGVRTVISTATRREAKKELADYILALVDDRI